MLSSFFARHRLLLRNVGNSDLAYPRLFLFLPAPVLCILQLWSAHTIVE